MTADANFGLRVPLIFSAPFSQARFGLASTMASAQHGPAARAWLEFSARRGGLERLKGARHTLLYAVYVYLVIEIAANIDSLVAHLEARYRWFDPRIPEPAKPLADLDFSAGIDHADASTIVGTAAAFVVTINIAVFAARLGGVQDLRGEMDISRWQRAMERLAPLAASIAFAVAATRFPREVGLGLGLLFIAAITLGASDVRIAGRLSALKMEVDIAEVSLIQAKDALAGFHALLPLPVRAKIPDDLLYPGHYRGRLALMVVMPVVLLQGVFSGVLIMIRPEDFRVLLNAGYLAVPAIVEVATMLTWGVLESLTIKGMTVRAKSFGAEGGVLSITLPFLKIPIILMTTVAAMALSPDGARVLVAVSVLAASTLFYVLLTGAALTGQGPGVNVVWVALAFLNEAVEAAKRRVASAVDEHEAEMRVHAELALEAKFNGKTTAKAP